MAKRAEEGDPGLCSPPKKAKTKKGVYPVYTDKDSTRQVALRSNRFSFAGDITGDGKLFLLDEYWKVKSKRVPGDIASLAEHYEPGRDFFPQLRKNLLERVDASILTPASRKSCGKKCQYTPELVDEMRTINRDFDGQAK